MKNVLEWILLIIICSLSCIGIPKLLIIQSCGLGYIVVGGVFLVQDLISMIRSDS